MAHGRDKEHVDPRMSESVEIVRMNKIQAYTDTNASKGRINAVNMVGALNSFIAPGIGNFEESFEFRRFLNVLLVKGKRLLLFLSPENLAAMIQHSRYIADVVIVFPNVKRSRNHNDKAVLT